MQQWRGPLRGALEQLASRMHDVYEREGASLFTRDPWDVRDAYGDVAAQDGETLDQFARSVVRAGANDDEVRRARELLELQRATLRLFTSCAWFFDEVDRIEVRQVLRYAARALELSGAAAQLTPEFVQWLTSATNGHPGAPSAADVFTREALPHRNSTLCVAAGMMALAQSVSGAADRVRRVATYDVSVGNRDDQWVVRTRHRRTGATAMFTGRVEGAGPSQVVHIAPENGATEQLRPHEFPEAVARELLRGSATDDVALLGAI
jgi:hypothetical protein